MPKFDKLKCSFFKCWFYSEIWKPPIDLIHSCRNGWIWGRDQIRSDSQCLQFQLDSLYVSLKIERPMEAEGDFILIFWSPLKRSSLRLLPIYLTKYPPPLLDQVDPKRSPWADLLPKVKQDRREDGRVANRDTASQELKVTLLHSKIVIFVRNIELERHPQ